jgi:hypothetical protein
MDLMRWMSSEVPPDDNRWQAQRRAFRHSDESLTGTARLWLRRLPANCRPLKLCARYPRVANRIAWCWPDPVTTEQVLEDLLVDHRGGRRGFPRPIELELRRLRSHNDQGRPGSSGEGWWTSLRRTLAPM